MSEEYTTIRVLGKKRDSYGIERYREFFCYGKRDAEKFCALCNFRFSCFSDKDTVELSVEEFDTDSIVKVTLDVLLKYQMNLDVTIEEKNGTKRAKVRGEYFKV